MKQERLYLLDWLRLNVLIAIAFLHCNEFVFFTDVIPHIGKFTVFEMEMRYHAWPLTLGGQVLVALIYLLFGYSKKSRPSLVKIAGFAFVGQFLVALSFFDGGELLSALEWDIYFFIAATNLLLLPLPRASWALTVGSFLLSLISPEQWKAIFPEGFIGDLLTGRNPAGPEGAWPLIPWFFFALLFFNLGALIREEKLSLSQWRKAETFAWPILIGVSLPFIGAYYATPLGPHYYEWNFHKPAWIFWANFFPYVLVMRLAFVESVRKKLAAHRLGRAVGDLMWNRHLGVSYIVSVLYIGVGAQFEEFFLAHPHWFDLFFLSVMPVTELVVRTLMRIRGKLPGGPSAR